MQKLILFLKGYVYIQITGFSPERFVNLCGNRNIFLWGIVKENECYYMNMSIKDFFLIAPLARKTKTKVVLLKRIGLPFLFPKLLKRKIFVFGLLMCFWIWWISSFFIWKIELNGNNQITDTDILRTLSDLNIEIGDRINGVDFEEVEKLLRKKYNQIIWISVKQKGTILEINIKEMYSIHKEPESSMPCDLISTKTGVVKDMIVRKGNPLVSIGEEVGIGDILISGKMNIYNDDGSVRQTLMLESDADIWIEYDLPVHIEIPKVYFEKYYTGRELKNLYLIIMDNKILTTNLKCKYIYYDCLKEYYKPISFLLWELPLDFVVIKDREYIRIEKENNYDEALIKLENEFSLFLANLMEKGVQIISKNVRIEESFDTYKLIGNLTVSEQAITRQDIEEIYE